MYEKAKTINNCYRTALMNRKYYACRLLWSKRLNSTLDLVAAIGSSAAVGAWSLWQTGPGALTWKILAAIATVVAISKPVLQPGKNIERYTELVTGWSVLQYDLGQLERDMRISRSVSTECWEAFLAAEKRMVGLGLKDDLAPRKRLHRRCYEEVKREIPANDLWWPPKEAKT